MGGDGRAVDEAHQIDGGAEHRHLEGKREGDRRADADNFREPLPVRSEQVAEDVGAAEIAVELDDGGQHQRAERIGDGAGDSRPGEAEARKAEVAVDQHPIAEQIDEDRDQGDSESDPRPAEGGDEVAQDDDRQSREHRPLHGAHELGRPARQLRILAERQQDGLAVPEDEHRRQRK